MGQQNCQERVWLRQSRTNREQKKGKERRLEVQPTRGLCCLHTPGEAHGEGKFCELGFETAERGQSGRGNYSAAADGGASPVLERACQRGVSKQVAEKSISKMI